MNFDLAHKPIAQRALALATEHHKGVYRKYSCKPYIEHPKAVARLLLQQGFYGENALAAAFLHDCVEDENIDGERMAPFFIEVECGTIVRRYVENLSDLEGGNREQRKAKSIARLIQAPSVVRDIKIADVMDNIKDIVEQNPQFAPQYLREKREMFEAFRGHETNAMLDQGFKLLKECEAKAAHLTIAEAKRAFENSAADRAKEAAENEFLHSILAAEENAFIKELAMF